MILVKQEAANFSWQLHQFKGLTFVQRCEHLPISDWMRAAWRVTEAAGATLTVTGTPTDGAGRLWTVILWYDCHVFYFYTNTIVNKWKVKNLSLNIGFHLEQPLHCIGRGFTHLIWKRLTAPLKFIQRAPLKTSPSGKWGFTKFSVLILTNWSHIY